MINVINVDTNQMNGSFLTVKTIIGCTIAQLRDKQRGMDPKHTVYVVSKSFKLVRDAVGNIQKSLSIHHIPHTYSLMHERINLA